MSTDWSAWGRHRGSNTIISCVLSSECNHGVPVCANEKATTVCKFGWKTIAFVWRVCSNVTVIFIALDAIVDSVKRYKMAFSLIAWYFAELADRRDVDTNCKLQHWITVTVTTYRPWVVRRFYLGRPGSNCAIRSQLYELGLCEICGDIN